MKNGKKKIGFILNPYAGIGGKAGLKGSDNYKEIEKLLKEGCERTAPKRAEICMSQIVSLTANFTAENQVQAEEDMFSILSAPGDMGEMLLKKLGISCDVVPCPGLDTGSQSLVSHAGYVDQEGLEAEEAGFTIGKTKLHTCAEDTKYYAKVMKEQGVDLLVFCGGDGTARDVCEAIGTEVTVLGIPAGVKMYSACFACNPYQAGNMLKSWLAGKKLTCEMREVLDIEEKDLNSRNVSPRLYGFLEVLNDGTHLQKAKEADSGAGESANMIAKAAIDRMKKDWVYIIGPGGTTWKMKEMLCENESLHGTVRGVDVVRNGKILFQDADEEDLWNCVNTYNHVKILVTCIGGNGFLFGRGNQQISPRVIRKVGKEQIEIIATKEKLAGLGGEPMHVDTGDADTDEYLKGYYKIMFCDSDSAIYKIG